MELVEEIIVKSKETKNHRSPPGTWQDAYREQCKNTKLPEKKPIGQKIFKVYRNGMWRCSATNSEEQKKCKFYCKSTVYQKCMFFYPSMDHCDCIRKE